MPLHKRLRERELFAARRLPLLAQRYTLDGDHFPHDHDFLEAVLVTGGTGRHCSVWGEQEVSAGDAFLLRPGVWHAYRGCCGLRVYNCCFGVGLVQRELAVLLEEPPLHALLWAAPLAGRAQDGIVRLRLAEAEQAVCQQHLDAVANAESFGAERAAHLLLFLGRLAACREKENSAPEGVAPRRKPLHPAIREGVRLLEEDPAYAWTLAELSDRLHLERSHLTRVFKEGAGLPPMAYLARHRAERAARLLLGTDLPVAEIAAAVGWPDANYFARRFRTHFGVSATAYRDRFAQNISRTRASQEREDRYWLAP